MSFHGRPVRRRVRVREAQRAVAQGKTDAAPGTIERRAHDEGAKLPAGTAAVQQELPIQRLAQAVAAPTCEAMACGTPA